MSPRLVFEIPSTPEGVGEALERVEAFLEETALSPAARGRCLYGLDDALQNARVHGNDGNPEKRIEIECAAGEEAVAFRVADQGNGFDWKGVLAALTASEETSFSMRGRPAGPEIRGLGLSIIVRLFRDVRFNERGSEIRFAKPYDSVEATFPRRRS